MTSEEPVRGGAGGGGDESEFNGSILKILTIVLVAVSFVVVVLRGVARHRFGRVLESTDILLPAALVLAIAQSSCVELALTSGLGSHFSSLDADQASQYLKLTYASNILFQLVVCLTQAIVVLLIKNVEPQRLVRIGCYLLLAVIGIYSVLATLYHVFQCALPEPWLVDSERCLDREVFQASVIVVSVVVDAATMILPIIMMWNVKTSTNRKILVCALFGTRIALPLVTIPQFQLLHTALTSSDPTWDTVSWQMWVQIIMNVSIITACLPSFGRMMWELWAFGSGLKSAPSSIRQPGSRDFGHELGLEHGYPQEKVNPYMNEPGPAVLSGDDEKYDKWNSQVVVNVREYGSFDSERTVVDLQKDLPSPPPRSDSRDPNRMKHHYRRPASITRSPALLAPAPALTAPERSPKPAAEQNPYTGATLRPPPPAQQQQQPGTKTKRIPFSSVYSDLPPLRSQASGSFYDEDVVSQHDIDSYYMGNKQMAGGAYIPSRTELVLQNMIEDLQRQNASVPSAPPNRNMEGGWI